MSDCSAAVETSVTWFEEEGEEDVTSQLRGQENLQVKNVFIFVSICMSVFTMTVFEMCVDEPEEVLVDNPAEVSWLAELLHGVSVDGPLLLPSSKWAG